MNRIIPILALLVLTSCDFYRGLIRSTYPGPEFDAAVAQNLASQPPGSVPHFIDKWDGETMGVTIQRGDVYVRVTYSVGNPISLRSVYLVTNEELKPLIHDSLGLQSEIIEVLRQRFPALPPQSEWTITWLSMEAPPDDVTESHSTDH